MFRPATAAEPTLDELIGEADQRPVATLDHSGPFFTAIDAVVDDRLTKLRADIAALAAVEAVVVAATLAATPPVVTAHQPSTVKPAVAPVTTAKPVGEPPMVFTIRRVTSRPWRWTKQVTIFFDTGAAAIARPFAALPLSARSKAVIAFGLVALLLVAPLSLVRYYQTLTGTKTAVLQSASAAAANLTAATQAVSAEQLADAAANFQAAEQQLTVADQAIDGIDRWITVLAKLVPSANKQLTTASALTDIGVAAAKIGQELTEALQLLEDPAATVIAKVDRLATALAVVAPELADLQAVVGAIDSSVVPEAQRPTVAELTAKLPLMITSAQRFSKIAQVLQPALGQQAIKRYLIVFQNNRELRATGGFIGSYALVDITNGQIQNIEIPGGGSYDLQGGLTERVASPAPLWLINPRWEFQDSNWWPDFPTSAQKMLWFYNHAGGPTVDGVIAINADAVADLLGVIGPVTAAGQTVTASNFFDVTQYQVEVAYDRTTNRPKEFIGQLAEPVLQQLLSANRTELIQLMTVLSGAMQRKDIQFYLTDQAGEQQVLDLGWGGQIINTGGDYLMVVATNIAGQKTDGVIRQQIDHAPTIAVDGTVTDTVTITREHHGIKNAPFDGMRNVSYLRVYVPAGSQLVSASGFATPAAGLFVEPSEPLQQDADLVRVSGITRTDSATGLKINQEFDKTVFGGWTQVDPGQTTTVQLTYRLPVKLKFSSAITPWPLINQWLGWLPLGTRTAPYTLTVQRQSGSPSEFTTRINYPPVLYPVWWSDPRMKIDEAAIQFASPLDADHRLGVLFTKP